jgi:uncharacterized repeat protein (TIGR01451 family)
MTMFAMLGFAGFVFADSGNTQVHRIGAASKIAKPLQVNEGPQGDVGPPSGDLDRAAAPANDTCAGAIPLPLNRTVVATTAEAADDYQTPATVGCYGGIGQLPTTAPGRDIVFSFTAPAAGNYSIRVIQQGPNADPTRAQNAVLYAVDGAGGCPAPGVVNCIAGANRPQTSAFATGSTGSSSNHSEELTCIPMAANQLIYVFFDDARVAGTAANPGGVTSLEAIPCNRESEPNDSIGQAEPFQCGVLGASNTGAVAHCALGNRAGQVCTRTFMLDESQPESNKTCSISGVPCTHDGTTGISTCAGGPNDLCQQHTDLDCDPRCDVGPRAGLACTSNAFCNPGSDQGAVCAGSCQIESECVDANNVSNGQPCTAICVGGTFPGRYCNLPGLAGSFSTVVVVGCPGGGTCQANAACPANFTCSRQFNEGDRDFYALGTFPANSKVFATVDAKSANDQDFRMRINSDTKTLQFNDDDGIGRNGALSPMLAGALTSAGEATYLQVSRSAPRAAEPYELNVVVRPPVAAAQLESEVGPTGNDIYFGWPGDVVNANYATSGGYVRGTFAVNNDSDCFKFIANEGDLMDWYGDGNPARTAGAVGIVNIPWPIIYDAQPAPISNFIFGMAPGRRNTNANVQTAGFTNLSPDVGPPGHLQWRATYTGMMEVCFYDDSSLIALGTPNHPGAWAGSLSVNCGPIQPAGPGSTTADVSVTKTVSAGPYTTGSFVTYTITVVNNSATDIVQEAHLFDSLDPNLVYVSLTADDSIDGDNIFCTSLPTPGQNDAPVDCINTSMAPGSTTTYFLTVQIANCIGAGIHIDNTVTIDTVSTDPNPANDSATVGIDTVEDGSCADLSCGLDSCVANLCTVNDHCEAGQCVNTPKVCDDQSICTDDSCDPATGCINDSSQVGGCYSDFNPCTFDTCDPIVGCSFPPVPDGTACIDYEDCERSCVQGSCTGAAETYPQPVVFFADKTLLTWEFVPGKYYDAVRGLLEQFPVGSGSAESCLGIGIYYSGLTDPQLPLPDRGFWYLVRRQNACDPGTWGHASDGTPRDPAVCP